MVASGCASSSSQPDATRADGSDDGPIGVVASTGIYADIASRIGGDDVAVTAIIENPNIDPHDYQGTARDVLALAEADVVIVNGGGYDAFMEQLIEGADNPDARVIDVTELSGLVEGGNEHVFYDPTNIRRLSGALSAAFSKVHPSGAARFRTATAALDEDLAGLEEQAASIATRHRGTKVAATDPAAEAFADTVELANEVPDAFMIAVEDGTGVAARVEQEVLDLIGGGAVRVVVTDAVIADPQVTDVLDEATAHRIPVVSVSELLPADGDYVSWMRDNLTKLDQALAGMS